jgi:hypothetical protein
VGKPTDALRELKIALDQSAQRRLTDPKARDLLETARTDDRLNNLRSLPEFQKLVPPK